MQGAKGYGKGNKKWRLLSDTVVAAKDRKDLKEHESFFCALCVLLRLRNPCLSVFILNREIREMEFINHEWTLTNSNREGHEKAQKAQNVFGPPALQSRTVRPACHDS
jgi:hypothetical protein